MTKGNVWIDIIFPDGPPIEYERPGVELTENLEWRKATRPVEEAHHHRLNKVLHPSTVTVELYQDAKRKAKRLWKTSRVYMGWEEASKPQSTPLLAQKACADQQAPPTPAVSSASATPNSLSASSSKDTNQPTPSSSTAPVDSALKNLGFLVPDPKSFLLDLSQFRQDVYKKSIRGPQLAPPRGSIVLRGLIEVYGERARMTYFVSAHYDLKRGSFKIRSFFPFNRIENRQSPKGGP